MIIIRPIQAHEIPAAKLVLHTVAYGIFGFDGSLEDSIRYFEAKGALEDMDHLREHYFDNNGIFLAALDGDRVIGSGAIRRLDETTAELKRMWLLNDYHGKGIGYQLATHLFDFARTHGYRRIVLQTSPEQIRAITFYHRLGFYEIPCYNDDLNEISMQFDLH
jgi:putative acetyltransferase